eukprot:306124-Chlamydomonas_euryale.AAC.1
MGVGAGHGSPPANLPARHARPDGSPAATAAGAPAPCTEMTRDWGCSDATQLRAAASCSDETQLPACCSGDTQLPASCSGGTHLPASCGGCKAGAAPTPTHA